MFQPRVGIFPSVLSSPFSSRREPRRKKSGRSEGSVYGAVDLRHEVVDALLAHCCGEETGAVSEDRVVEVGLLALDGGSAGCGEYAACECGHVKQRLRGKGCLCREKMFDCVRCCSVLWWWFRVVALINNDALAYQSRIGCAETSPYGQDLCKGGVAE